jgi:hypothetical protein
MSISPGYVNLILQHENDSNHEYLLEKHNAASFEASAQRLGMIITQKETKTLYKAGAHYDSEDEYEVEGLVYKLKKA